MPTYATNAELVQRYGTAALTAMVPSDVTDPLTTLTGQAQVEAAGEIDAALEGCGYAVPVDTSAIVDADHQARAAALLRRMELGLTVAALSRGVRGSSKKSHSSARGSITYAKFENDTTWARDRLKALCDRSETILGVTSPGRTFVRHSEAAVPDADDVTDRINAAGGW